MLPAPGGHNIRVAEGGGGGWWRWRFAHGPGRTEGRLLAGEKERLLSVPRAEESWGLVKCSMGSLKGSCTTGETNDNILWFLSSTNGICFLLNE